MFSKGFDMLPFGGKFRKDVVWTMASFCVLGVAGILLNVIIGHHYGADVLGVFNQVFAFYIFFSQFAVFGIWFSVLKYVSANAEDKSICDSIIAAAIIAAMVTSSVVALVTFILSDFMGDLLGSPNVTRGWLYVLPGFWCYSLNKVLMATLNGFRNMKAYAIAQMMRYVLMILFLILFLVVDVNVTLLPAVISVPEVFLMCALLVYTRRHYRVISWPVCVVWMKKHLHFGSRSFLSGTLAEINTRIDVIMLGCFVGDSTVGVYSFAAMIVEGMSQLSVVFRDNLNPVVARLLVDSKTDELQTTIRRGVKLFYLGMLPVTLVAVFCYPWFVDMFVRNPDFAGSWIPFSILMGGMFLASGYLPFNMLLVQGGHPVQHTSLKFAAVLSNIMLNLILIPLFGMVGAAMATAISFVLAALYLKVLTAKVLRIRI